MREEQEREREVENLGGEGSRENDEDKRIYQDNSGGIQVRIYEGRRPTVTQRQRDEDGANGNASRKLEEYLVMSEKRGQQVSDIKPPRSSSTSNRKVSPIRKVFMEESQDN